MKKKLVIFGRVHDVGYRPFLLGIAESLEIERFFADNISIAEKHAIHVLVDSSKEKVDSFIGIVSSKYPKNASVEEVKVEDYSGNVMKTENYYRYLTSMQLHKIATYGGRMLDKQDETIKEIKGVREDVKGVREAVEGVREDVKNASTRQDRTNELLESRFNRMQEDIEKIKSALTRAGIEV